MNTSENNLFAAKGKESAVDIVINKIKQLLLEHKLNPGDKLPSEMELAEGLNVSRGSLREAMKVLAALGIVEVKAGNGTYIVDKPKDNLLDPLLFNFLIINPKLTELSEFRKLIESNIIELVIAHYDENEKERILLKKNLNSLKELQKSENNLEKIIENDMEFHHILGDASHNSLARKIYSFVMDFYKVSIQNTHTKQKSGQIALKSHEDILKTIESRDVSRIKKSVDICVDSWETLQS